MRGRTAPQKGTKGPSPFTDARPAAAPRQTAGEGPARPLPPPAAAAGAAGTRRRRSSVGEPGPRRRRPRGPPAGRAGKSAASCRRPLPPGRPTHDALGHGGRSRLRARAPGRRRLPPRGPRSPGLSPGSCLPPPPPPPLQLRRPAATAATSGASPNALRRPRSPESRFRPQQRPRMRTAAPRPRPRPFPTAARGALSPDLAMWGANPWKGGFVNDIGSPLEPEPHRKERREAEITVGGLCPENRALQTSR